MRRGMKKVYRRAERHVHEKFLYQPQGDPGSSDGNGRVVGDSRGFEGKNFFRDFTMQEKLGDGGSSRVFKAVAKRGVSQERAGGASNLFAVKRIKRRGLSEQGKRKLDEEVLILRSLDHPNIVGIYHFYENDPLYYYMVTEFMAGGELFDRILQKFSRQETYNEGEARDLCRILVGGVKFCHDRDIVHRDLKPENVLLASPTDDASIKIADFGLACSVRDGPIDGWCGTPGYMAPEILYGKPYGKAVDMWSTGVIVYLLLGGYLPFGDRRTTEIFQKTKAGEFKFYDRDWRGVSSEAKSFIRGLLVVDETKRTTAAEAVNHPWLLAPGTSLAEIDLSESMDRFSVFNAKRKLRAAITSVMLARRVASRLEDACTKPSEHFSDVFVLEEQMGSGAFATVFKATTTTFVERLRETPAPGDGSSPSSLLSEARPCFAVKRTTRKGLSKAAERSVFEEVHIMRRLDHPSVVAVYEFYEADPEYYYMVMEFMAGGHLLDRIVRQTCYNEEDARDVCRVLLDAVKYCHDRGVAHRDLKLENLLLASPTDNTSVKLADFGFACNVDSGGVGDGGGNLTGVCGSPGYVAPEVLKGVRYGTSADMWSVGVVIFIVLCGRRPFHDKDRSRQFQKIKDGKFVFREEHWGGISEEAKDLIRKLLTVDAATRLTASEAVDHPWLFATGRSLAANNLDSNLEQLRIFNASRKLRGAIRSIVATNKIASTVGLEL